MSVNALRSHLAEFGLVVAKGTGRVDELLSLAEGDTGLPDAAVMAARVLGQKIDALGGALNDLERQIAKVHALSETSRSLGEIPGIGKLVASVIAASVPDPSVFNSGRDFAAWLGLTPRQIFKRG